MAHAASTGWLGGVRTSSYAAVLFYVCTYDARQTRRERAVTLGPTRDHVTLGDGSFRVRRSLISGTHANHTKILTLTILSFTMTTQHIRTHPAVHRRRRHWVGSNVEAETVPRPLRTPQNPHRHRGRMKTSLSRAALSIAIAAPIAFVANSTAASSETYIHGSSFHAAFSTYQQYLYYNQYGVYNWALNSQYGPVSVIAPVPLRYTTTSPDADNIYEVHLNAYARNSSQPVSITVQDIDNAGNVLGQITLATPTGGTGFYHIVNNTGMVNPGCTGRLIVGSVPAAVSSSPTNLVSHIVSVFIGTL